MLIYLFFQELFSYHNKHSRDGRRGLEYDSRKDRDRRDDRRGERSSRDRRRYDETPKFKVI